VWLWVCLTGLSAASAAAMYGLPGGSTPGPYGLPPSPHPAAAAAAAAAAAHQLANSFYAAAPHPSAPHDLAHHMSWSVTASTRTLLPVFRRKQLTDTI